MRRSGCAAISPACRRSSRTCSTTRRKYTEEGGAIELSLAVSPEGQAVIGVSDNGIGIDDELLPNVFELFEQGKRSLDRSQGGLGVGLTWCGASSNCTPAPSRPRARARARARSSGSACPASARRSIRTVSRPTKPL
jgi:hypothetical protein